MEDIIPDLVNSHGPASIRNMLNVFDGLNYPHLLSVCQMIQSNMNRFTTTIKRNNLLPSPVPLTQGADPYI